jgi:hypothetical protein
MTIDDKVGFWKKTALKVGLAGLAGLAAVSYVVQSCEWHDSYKRDKAIGNIAQHVTSLELSPEEHYDWDIYSIVSSEGKKLFNVLILRGQTDQFGGGYGGWKATFVDGSSDGELPIDGNIDMMEFKVYPAGVSSAQYFTSDLYSIEQLWFYGWGEIASAYRSVFDGANRLWADVVQRRAILNQGDIPSPPNHPHYRDSLIRSVEEYEYRIKGLFKERFNKLREGDFSIMIPK